MEVSNRPWGAIRLLIALGLGTALAACGDSPTDPTDGPPPSVSAVEPTTGTVGTDLRITGLNFRSAANVKVGTLSATPVDVTSAAEIFATVPSGVVAGETYDITVTNSDGTEVVFPQAFTAVTPTLQFVNGATKPSGNAGSTVILEGSAFGDTQGPGEVLFSDGQGGTVPATIANVDDWTDSFILTTVPAGADSGPVLIETGTGPSSSLPFTITQNATFSPSAITWSETQALPEGLSGHSGTYVPIDDETGSTVQRVYVIGGSASDSIPATGVYYSTIQGDGAVGTWNTGTALSSGVTHHVSVAATPFNSKVSGSGFLYVMGGVETKGGDPVSTIRRVPLNQDGTTGSAVSVGSLPAPMHSFGAVIFRSTIYVAGGATTGDVPTAEVYRAAIDTLGNVGPWEALAPLPAARAYHQFVGFGGFLYAVGGDTAALPIDDANFTQNASKLATVVHARINLRTGLLSDGWVTSGTSMQKARSKHVALAAGGSLFVSSGLYAAAGTGSSENSYATINSDGTLGSFGGATGSNTLLSIGGANLFNARGISYVDANGVAHVMILGGDDVNDPGVKSAKVLFY